MEWNKENSSMDRGASLYLFADGGRQVDAKALFWAPRMHPCPGIQPHSTEAWSGPGPRGLDLAPPQLCDEASMRFRM